MLSRDHQTFYIAEAYFSLCISKICIPRSKNKKKNKSTYTKSIIMPFAKSDEDCETQMENSEFQTSDN